MSDHHFDEVSAKALRSRPGKPLDLMRIELSHGKKKTTIVCPIESAYKLAECIVRCCEQATAENDSRGGGLPS